jgi:hypothetical protein
MPIDPSIPLQVKPFNIDLPVNQLAAVGEAIKIGEMNRGIEEQNRLNEYLKSADLSKPETRQELIKYGKTGLAYGKALGEQEKLGLETKKLGVETRLKQLDVQREQFGNLVFNPSDANVTAHLQDSVLKGELPQAQAQSLLQQVMPMNAAQRKQFFTDMAVKAETRYQGDISKRGQDISATTTMRGQDISAATTRRGQDLSSDPTLQGRIEEAKVLGKARGEEITAPFKDIQANVKALKSAGYDPETGKDSISDLIQKSTGSYAGAATDFAGRTVGISTGGAKAIASLKTYESKLTQDLLGGKMGAGISNADRDFIVAGIGQIADPTLPVETRQAAWNSVKERMRVAGMVPAPKGEGAPADNPYAKKTDAEIKKELGL